MKATRTIPFKVRVVGKGKHAGEYHLQAAHGAYTRVAQATGKSVKKLHRLAAKKKRKEHKQGYSQTPMTPMKLVVRTKAKTHERSVKKHPGKHYEKLIAQMGG